MVDGHRGGGGGSAALERARGLPEEARTTTAHLEAIHYRVTMDVEPKPIPEVGFQAPALLEPCPIAPRAISSRRNYRRRRGKRGQIDAVGGHRYCDEVPFPSCAGRRECSSPVCREPQVVSVLLQRTSLAVETMAGARMRSACPSQTGGVGVEVGPRAQKRTTDSPGCSQPGSGISRGSDLNNSAAAAASGEQPVAEASTMARTVRRAPKRCPAQMQNAGGGRPPSSSTQGNLRAWTQGDEPLIPRDSKPPPSTPSSPIYTVAPA